MKISPSLDYSRRLKRLFFASGACGLAYEMVFVKVFGYVFGTTAHAVAAVLAGFMLGLALGGYLFGILAKKIKHPLRAYAVMELLIGVFCLLTPIWHSLVTELYLGIHAQYHPDPSALTVIQVVVTMALLLIPSMLMGGTLPIMLKSGIASDASLAGDVGSFYLMNLSGAATGVFLTTFLLMPFFGIYGTLTVAFVVNLVICIKALRIVLPVATDRVPSPATSPTSFERMSFGVAALIAIFSGLSSLAYENIFTHVLATVIGSSVYAFGTMLFTFLLGLAVGSRISIRCVEQGKGVVSLGGALLGTAVTIACTMPFYDRIDVLFQIVGYAAPSFIVMEGVRFLVSFLLLLPPAILIGMVFPICMEISQRAPDEAPLRVGKLYALNTLASVLGSALAGFCLISRFGSEISLKAIGAAGICVGVIVVFSSSARRGKKVMICAAAVIVFVVGAVLVPGWNIQRLTGGRWVYFTHAHDDAPVIFFEEDVEGGMTTVTEEAGDVRTLWSNGKFQGNNQSEMKVQWGFAVYPILFLDKFDRALNIGFGTGVTAGTIGRFPFKEIDIAEIAPSVVRASRYFTEENRHILEDPRVAMHICDGRNALLLNDRSYDLISMEVSSIWIAGAANLYNTEFYELCAKRLNSGGVFQQWIQLHHIDTFDLVLIMNTARQVFRYCVLFRVDHQGILVCSNDPLDVDYGVIRSLDARPEVTDIVASLPMLSLLTYLGDLMLTPEEYDAALDLVVGRLGRWGKYYVSSDYMPMLEYATPKGNALRFALEANVGYLERYGKRRLPNIVGIVPHEFLGAILERRGDYDASLLRYQLADPRPEVLDRIMAVSKRIRQRALVE